MFVLLLSLCSYLAAVTVFALLLSLYSSCCCHCVRLAAVTVFVLLLSLCFLSGCCGCVRLSVLDEEELSDAVGPWELDFSRRQGSAAKSTNSCPHENGRAICNCCCANKANEPLCPYETEGQETLTYPSGAVLVTVGEFCVRQVLRWGEGGSATGGE